MSATTVKSLMIKRYKKQEREAALRWLLGLAREFNKSKEESAIWFRLAGVLVFQAWNWSGAVDRGVVVLSAEIDLVLKELKKGRANDP